jgi:predicted nuclease with TOPRIM domain
MTREELMTKKKKLLDELNSVEKELDLLEDKIRAGKIIKMCKLMKELYCEHNALNTLEINDRDRDTIYIDLEDLAEEIVRNFDLSLD